MKTFVSQCTIAVSVVGIQGGFVTRLKILGEPVMGWLIHNVSILILERQKGRESIE